MNENAGPYCTSRMTQHHQHNAEHRDINADIELAMHITKESTHHYGNKPQWHVRSVEFAIQIAAKHQLLGHWCYHHQHCKGEQALCAIELLETEILCLSRIKARQPLLGRRQRNHR